MKAETLITGKKMFCMALLCVLILAISFQASATRITFDEDGVADGMAITDYYSGVKFNGFGLYPSGGNTGLGADYNAYAYQDDHSLSGDNVLGVSVPGGATYLQMGYNYAVVRFDNPTGYISVEGVGDPFEVYVCSDFLTEDNIDNWQLYDIYEVDPGSGVVRFELNRTTLLPDGGIQTVLIGGKTGPAWFDNFTYGEPYVGALPIC